MHIMIDLETMGTRPNAPVLSIGAVAFDGNRVHGEFYEVLDLSFSVRDGAVIDPETVIWWMTQSDEARLAVTRRGIEPRVALTRFTEWMDQKDFDGVWGNGASFDNVILSETYRRLGMTPPWKFWQDRCYRTVRTLHPSVPLERSGTHHNALDDARSQAVHLIEMHRASGGIL